MSKAKHTPVRSKATPRGVSRAAPASSHTAQCRARLTRVLLRGVAHEKTATELLGGEFDAERFEHDIVGNGWPAFELAAHAAEVANSYSDPWRYLRACSEYAQRMLQRVGADARALEVGHALVSLTELLSMVENAEAEERIRIAIAALYAEGSSEAAPWPLRILSDVAMADVSLCVRGSDDATVRALGERSAALVQRLVRMTATLDATCGAAHRQSDEVPFVKSVVAA